MSDGERRLLGVSSIDAWLDRFAGWRIDPDDEASPRRPLVMGVLNVTPDSFSDGGKYLKGYAATGRAATLEREGADILDVGGESTRPGSEPVDADEQKRRILNVIEVAASDLGMVVSVDTSSADVASAALDAGAAIVNDVTAGRGDEAMFDVMKRARACVLMHMRGTPRTMQAAPAYEDVVGEVEAFLLERAQAAEAAGVEKRRIVLDPGIGFGKTIEHNLRLLKEIDRFSKHGYPVLLGASRKRFLGEITGEPDAAGRDDATTATTCWGITRGVSIVRVHDVRAARHAVDTTLAIQSAPDISNEAGSL